MQNIESLFKYKSRIYNVQSNSYINHIGMKMQWNSKLFPSLNLININSSPHGRKGVLRNYCYR